MKFKIWMIIIPIVFAACNMNSKNKFVIKGTVTGIENGWIYLQKEIDGQMKRTDSTIIKKGKFTLKGKTGLPAMRYLVIDGGKGIYAFFIENSKMTMKVNADNMEKSEISGSESDKIYQEYQAKAAEIDIQLNEIYVKYKEAKKLGKKDLVYKYKADMNKLDDRMTVMLKDFITQKRKSVVSLYLVVNNLWRFELGDLQNSISGIDSALKASEYFVKISSRIETLKKVTVGQPALNFSMNNTDGKPVSLSSFRGKIVLVDFWASWCPDCRVENPNVVASYHKYHPKGLEILGVSLDRDRDNWLKAIREDGLIWKQVSDLKDWDNAASRLYGVMSIPANVLVDKEGKIIGRNLYGEALNTKLNEVFSK